MYAFRFFSQRVRSRGRRLRVESLEPRVLLAGDTFLVNFQFDEATPPATYLRDTGEMFGDRGGGLRYGWSSDHNDQARERNLHPDQRFDTLVHFEAGQIWEFELANGLYEVTVAVGDPANNDGVHTINLEDVNLLNAVPDTDVPLVATAAVVVNDGRLTVDQGAAAHKSTRINFVHIVGLPNGPNAVPQTPTIDTPSAGGQPVNPQDVHMQASGFVDSDGDVHKSSDWEIWTLGPTAEPVWQTLGIEATERLHSHLSDGVFINGQAGDTALAENTNYELRVRFRDDAGSVSNYAVRSFQTGSATATYPLELLDVSNAQVPSWENLASMDVVLPPDGAQLRVEAAATGEPLLTISGQSGTGNQIDQFPSLGSHSAVRLVVEAGSGGLALPETDLAFPDDSGELVTIFLPETTFTPQGRLVLWVASTGATYFGNAAQTAPDFSILARADSSDVPFVATQPGFVVEAVGFNYRLPVNIAFVPNPGPNPDDPLYFVTELYGSIQVVTRDGTKREFATGLLDYNPTGPISGSGEQGLTGIAVERDANDPEIYHLYVGLLWDNGSPPGGPVHYPKVERITSASGGLTMASRTVLLNMQPETQGQSHQISNITIGPDDKLYVHNGDGFVFSTGQDLDSFRGKVLRLNKDGSAPTDNPFYNETDGIAARDYVFAYGLRNPFGGAWRTADGTHYSVENGPSVDRLSQINEGVNYGWDGSNSSMFINAIYNWSPAVAPVNIAFVEPETFAGSQFPAAMQDRAFVSESGPTYASGPQSRGKRLTEFQLDLNGDLVSGPNELVTYIGDGRSTVVGLAAGPEGLYFTALYEDSGENGPTASGARIFRVRYVNPLAGDYDIDGDVDQDDYTVWKSNFGSNLLLAADGNGDGRVNSADYVVWRDNLGATAAVGAHQPTTALADKIPPAHTVETSDLAFAAFGDATKLENTSELTAINRSPPPVTDLAGLALLLVLGEGRVESDDKLNVGALAAETGDAENTDVSILDDELNATVQLELR